MSASFDNRRRISRAALRVLRAAYSQYGERPFRGPGFPGFSEVGGDFARLGRYWGLVENQGKGTWRILPKGVAFLNGHLTVPSHVLENSGRRATWAGWAGIQVTFEAAISGQRIDADVAVSAPR